MSYCMDDITAGGQLHVGAGLPLALGIGPAKINGGAFVEGPFICGKSVEWPIVGATLMVGPLTNSESLTPSLAGALCPGINNSPYSLAISGPSAMLGPVDTREDVTVGGDLNAQGEVRSRCGKHILSAKKNFDIPHPTRQGWRLRHTCPEGPSNDVYYRGRVTI